MRTNDTVSYRISSYIPYVYNLCINVNVEISIIVYCDTDFLIPHHCSLVSMKIDELDKDRRLKNLPRR